MLLASPASRAQWMVPPRAVKFASNSSSSSGSRAMTDSLIARPASRSSSQSGSSDDDGQPLVPDGPGGVAEVGPQLGVAELAAGGFREGLVFVQVADAEDRQGRHPQECAAHRAVLPVVRRTSPETAAGFSRVLARISAKCIVVTPLPCRDSPPPMCIRQDASPPAQRSAPGAADVGGLVRQHRRGHVRVLHREGAAEAAALVGLGQFDQFDAADRAQQVQLAVAEPEQAHAVAAGVVGDPVREVRAQLRRRVGDAQDIHQELGELVGFGSDVGGPGFQPGVPAAAGDHGVLVLHGGDAGAGRCDGDVVLIVFEGLHMVGDDGQRLLEVAAVDVHLPAAGLAGREDRPRGRGVPGWTPWRGPWPGTWRRRCRWRTARSSLDHLRWSTAVWRAARADGHVLRRVLGGTHHGAQLPQPAAEHAGGAGLDQDVAEGRGLDRVRRARACRWRRR